MTNKSQGPNHEWRLASKTASMLAKTTTDDGRLLPSILNLDSEKLNHDQPQCGNEQLVRSRTMIQWQK
jgi:hypothetical protein